MIYKLTALAVLSLLGPIRAPATVLTTYSIPADGGYTAITTIIPIVGANFTSTTSETDGTVTASFSATLNRRTVGDGWGTWASPPDTEGATPRVLYGSGLATIDITFSTNLLTFGVEAEPNELVLRSMVIEYFADAVSLGTISRSIHGSSGARLLAGTTDLPFNKVRISMINDANGATAEDFAFGQMRYAVDPSSVPEPSSLVLVGAGIAGVLTLRRRRAKPS